MDRSSRQKIKNETMALNNILDQMKIIDILRKFHPKAAEYTYVSSAHGTFSRIDHMLGQKTNLNEFEKTVLKSSYSL